MSQGVRVVKRKMDVKFFLLYKGDKREIKR